jgi:hypothetical protein
MGSGQGSGRRLDSTRLGALPALWAMAVLLGCSGRPGGGNVASAPSTIDLEAGMLASGTAIGVTPAEPEDVRAEEELVAEHLDAHLRVSDRAAASVRHFQGHLRGPVLGDTLLDGRFAQRSLSFPRLRTHARS